MYRLAFQSALLVLFILSIQPYAITKTIHVPADYPKIQEAVNASEKGDVILVSPGTYEETINFKGKAITLKSNVGPHVTRIDAGYNGTAVRFDSGEGADSILDGFYITRGSQSGVHCTQSSPTIRNNMIINNLNDSGFNSSAGGGVYCSLSSAIITNNVISDNHCNAQFSCGAGMYCDEFTGTITNNVITYNKIYGMTMARGAGVYLQYSLATVAGNIIAFNILSWEGGGIFMLSSSADITNNTIYYNNSTLGGGICCMGKSEVSITNTILWNNYGVNGGNEAALVEYNGQGSKLSVDYSDVMGGQALVHIESGCSLDWGTSNIDQRPAFVDEKMMDYHLKFQSPCRNAGDNSASGILENDFEGDSRIVDGTVDIGADEFTHHLYHHCDPFAYPPPDWTSIRLIGKPNSLFHIFVGSGLLDPPQVTKYGPWHLQFPASVYLTGTMPWSGVISMDERIFGDPLSFPLQAFVGRSLTNPDLLWLKD